MPHKRKLYGLIVCGGNSSRMGEDKSMLVYYDKPQRYHLYEMLSRFCKKVFISCNSGQTTGIEPGYNVIIDLPAYSNTGPMASLLSAFDQYPENDFLIVGCDYPHLVKEDIETFISSFQKNKIAAAFYNTESALYEPLLGYYDHRCAPALLEMHAKNEHSLQHFLETQDADKFYPSNKQSMQSIDTREAYLNAKKIITKSL